MRFLHTLAVYLLSPPKSPSSNASALKSCAKKVFNLHKKNFVSYHDFFSTKFLSSTSKFHQILNLFSPFAFFPAPDEMNVFLSPTLSIMFKHRHFHFYMINVITFFGAMVSMRFIFANLLTTALVPY